MNKMDNYYLKYKKYKSKYLKQRRQMAGSPSNKITEFFDTFTNKLSYYQIAGLIVNDSGSNIIYDVGDARKLGFKEMKYIAGGNFGKIYLTKIHRNDNNVSIDIVYDKTDVSTKSEKRKYNKILFGEIKYFS